MSSVRTMSKITPEYRAMRPFREYSRAVQYLCAGYFTCLNNLMVPFKGGEYKYTVHI